MLRYPTPVCFVPAGCGQTGTGRRADQTAVRVDAGISLLPPATVLTEQGGLFLRGRCRTVGPGHSTRFYYRATFNGDHGSTLYAWTTYHHPPRHPMVDLLFEFRFQWIDGTPGWFALDNADAFGAVVSPPLFTVPVVNTTAGHFHPTTFRSGLSTALPHQHCALAWHLPPLPPPPAYVATRYYCHLPAPTTAFGVSATYYYHHHHHAPAALQFPLHLLP